MKSLSFVAALTVLFGATSLLRSVPPPPTSVVADSYRVDGVHSSVIFRVKHMGIANFYGRFNEISGSFDFDPKDPSKLSIDVQINAESIDTHSQRRDRHLKGPDFFNASQFPSISFKSKSAKKAGPESYEVKGELELHGVTRPLTVKVEHTGSGRGPRGDQREGFETTFTIKRSEFDMKFMLRGLSDEVRITLSVEGVLK